MDDAQLLDACRRGDTAAFEELVHRHERRIYHLAFRLLQNQADAQETTQEVFIRAFRAMAGFRGGARIGTWLYRIAVNACLDRLKRTRRAAEVPIEEASWEESKEAGPLAEATGRELKERVARVLEGLPPRQRATVVLRIYEDLSLAEIATVLEAPLGTVKANYHHGLRKVRQALRALVEGREEENPRE